MQGPEVDLFDDVRVLLIYDVLFWKRLRVLELFGLVGTRFFEQAAGCESKC